MGTYCNRDFLVDTRGHRGFTQNHQCAGVRKLLNARVRDEISPNHTRCVYGAPRFKAHRNKQKLFANENLLLLKRKPVRPLKTFGPSVRVSFSGEIKLQRERCFRQRVGDLDLIDGSGITNNL